MRALISNLAPIGKHEAMFFCELADAFTRLGWQPVLLSTVPCPGFPGEVIEFDWDLQHVLAEVDGTPAAADLDTIDQDVWTARLATLIKQGPGHEDVTGTLRRLVRWSRDLLDRTQPDLFLAWNNLCPHVGVLDRLCRAAGTPVAHIERAILPDTWFLSTGGLLGHDPTAGRSIESMGFDADMCRDMLEVGRARLRQLSFDSYEKYTQFDADTAIEALDRLRKDWPGPAMVFFPPDDGTVGFTPHGHPDRRASLPAFESSLQEYQQAPALV